MSWITVGVHGTAKVVQLKTNLKSLRQKNSLAVKSRIKELGLFKEFVSEEDQQLSGFQNSKLKKVAEALKVVESSYDLVTDDISELTSLLCELQNSTQLSEAQIAELKTDVSEQEKKYEGRTKENDVVVSEANKLLVKWEYAAPPEPTPRSPFPIAYPLPTQRRRFVAVDGFKPKVLGLDTSNEDFTDSRNAL